MPELRIIRNYVGVPDSHTVESYISRDGYIAFRKALKMDPDEIIDEIKKAGLRVVGARDFQRVLSGVSYKGIPRSLFICVVMLMRVSPGVLKIERFWSKIHIRCLRA